MDFPTSYAIGYGLQARECWYSTGLSAISYYVFSAYHVMLQISNIHFYADDSTRGALYMWYALYMHLATRLMKWIEQLSYRGRLQLKVSSLG